MNTCNMQISIEREADGSFVKTGQETEETAPPPKKDRNKKEKERLCNCHFLKIVSGELSSL